MVAGKPYYMICDGYLYYTRSKKEKEGGDGGVCV